MSSNRHKIVQVCFYLNNNSSVSYLLTLQSFCSTQTQVLDHFFFGFVPLNISLWKNNQEQLQMNPKFNMGNNIKLKFPTIIRLRNSNVGVFACISSWICYFFAECCFSVNKCCFLFTQEMQIIGSFHFCLLSFSTPKRIKFGNDLKQTIYQKSIISKSIPISVLPYFTRRLKVQRFLPPVDEVARR